MPSRGTLNILALGDIIGKPGRVALAKNLDALIQECNADFVLANGENASGGLGITPQVAEELLSLSIDMLTSGNHIWKHREIRGFLDSQPRLLRPANYPDGSPGRGSGLYQAQNGMTIAVLNLEGLLFMNPLPCPFRTADRELEALRRKTPLCIVDFHAEATSEKRALGHYLDGRVTAVVGTHTHIPTADAEVLPGGTGYLTDLGMCGPTDSVIGIRKEHAIARFTEKLPTNFQVAKGRVQIQGALIVADAKTGKCLEIVQRAWSV
jgi:metallophosphoesterase (TIGR00282 family)